MGTHIDIRAPFRTCNMAVAERFSQGHQDERLIRIFRALSLDDGSHRSFVELGFPAVVGSNTAPVQEVIAHEQNGLLVDFFNAKALAHSIASLVKDRDRAANLGRGARQTVLDHYELNACLQQHLALIKLVASAGLGA